MLKSLRRHIASIIYPEYTIDTIELSQVRERNLDLYSELQDHLKGRVITPPQWNDIQRVQQEHTRMMKEQEQIVLYLRESLPGFKDGKYGYYKGFGDLIVSLLKTSKGISEPEIKQ